MGNSDVKISTVLVTDDDPIIQLTVRAVMEKHNYKVWSCGNGHDCVEILRTNELPALLLLDLSMPVMDGIQVLEHLRMSPKYNELPIIVFSAKNELTVVRQAIKLGAWDYILKPFNLEDLGKRVSDLIFEFDFQEIQKTIKLLHMKDDRLFSSPGLRRYKDLPFDAYATLDHEKSLCVLIPEGVPPKTAAKWSLAEFNNKILIFRKCSYGWRKVWPRNGSEVDFDFEIE